MNKPNFVIVGQPKAGTTALYYLLKQHPEIHIENHGCYFPEDLIKDKTITKEEYLKKFEVEEKAIGDSSEGCIYSTRAISKIKDINYEMKIIIILRNPIDWLRSYYQQLASRLNETRKIDEMVLSKEYLDKTNYTKYVKRYFENFPRKNIKIIIFEDFKKDNQKTIGEIYNFLNVDSNFHPVPIITNESKLIKFPGFFKMLKKMGISLDDISQMVPSKLWESMKKDFLVPGNEKISKKVEEELRIRLSKNIRKINNLLNLDKNLCEVWGIK